MMGKYEGMKHRIAQLRNRVKLDSGPEQETAKRLLTKLEKKIAKYEKEHPYEVKTHETDWNPNPNFTWQVHFEEYDDTYRDDTRSEEQKADDLGILYAMFGSTYTTQIRGHVYKVRFKKQTSK